MRAHAIQKYRMSKVSMQPGQTTPCECGQDIPPRSPYTLGHPCVQVSAMRHTHTPVNNEARTWRSKPRDDKLRRSSIDRRRKKEPHDFLYTVGRKRISGRLKAKIVKSRVVRVSSALLTNRLLLRTSLGGDAENASTNMSALFRKQDTSEREAGIYLNPLTRPNAGLEAEKRLGDVLPSSHRGVVSRTGCFDTHGLFDDFSRSSADGLSLQRGVRRRGVRSPVDADETCSGLFEPAGCLPPVKTTDQTVSAPAGLNNITEENYRRGQDWGTLPSEALLRVFSHVTVQDLGRLAQTCSHWNYVSQHPLLWQSFEFNLSHDNRCDSQPKPTSKRLIDFILRHHTNHLKFVVFRTDSTVESARTACCILTRLVNCSLKTLSLISTARPVFLDVDRDSFMSALTVVLDRSNSLSSLAIDHTPVDDPSLEALASSGNSRTLQLLKMKSCPRVSPGGILALPDNCRCLRSLSLSYTLLSDDLLLSLSAERHARLEKLRVDIHTDDGLALPTISSDSWRSLVAHSPGVRLVMFSFSVREEAFDALFTSYVPVTHLFFGDYAPKRVLGRLGRFCPRLRELVVGANGSTFLDEELKGIALGCANLERLGLAECEVTCAGFVEVVERCGGRLQHLFVTEECLVEDSEYDITQTCKRISELLGREWCPEFVPCW